MSALPPLRPLRGHLSPALRGRGTQVLQRFHQFQARPDVLFKQASLDKIARNEVTLAFRRWKRPTVKAGSRVRTASGVVRIGATGGLKG